MIEDQDAQAQVCHERTRDTTAGAPRTVDQTDEAHNGRKNTVITMHHFLTDNALSGSFLTAVSIVGLRDKHLSRQHQAGD